MADSDKISVSVLLTKGDRKKLRQMALDDDTSVSALIRTWIAAAWEIRNND